jgi:hypothetical protein
VSSLLVCQSTMCLHLPQCYELTCCCLIFLCYAKLFTKKNYLLTMYYKVSALENVFIAELYISFWVILSSSQSKYLGSLGKYLYRL